MIATRPLLAGLAYLAVIVTLTFGLGMILA